MAYNQELAERVERLLAARPDLEMNKMFGGLCFMLSKHMCCGIVGDMLMARVGPDQYEDALNEPYAAEMDFTGKAMKGMVYVSTGGISEVQQLETWINRCIHFIESLPPKTK